MTTYLGSRTLLRLDLVAIPSDKVRGIYGTGNDRLPKRMRWLHPDAAASFVKLGVVVSDMFRSAESSLWAIRNRKGACRPGYSGHNYGQSIDLAIRRSLRALSLDSKRGLDEHMQGYGWYCHRRDHRQGFESWHYNFGVSSYIRDSDKRTSSALERLLRDRFGAAWKMSAEHIQGALAELGLYRGAIDGDLGPISKEATRAFQRCWGLAVDGIPGKRTQRTLSYVTASRPT